MKAAKKCFKCHVYVKFKWTNESCSSSKINQSTNAECSTCDRNGKQFFQWKLEKPWSLDKARNVLIQKVEISGE